MPINLMFIDDDIVYVEILERVCREDKAIGLVLTSHDGMEASEKVQSWVADRKVFPDKIFVDINMPAVSGFEFLQNFNQLRKKHPELCGHSSVMILSSSESPRDREMAAVLGAQGYIVKPHGLHEIRGMIEREVAEA